MLLLSLSLFEERGNTSDGQSFVMHSRSLYVLPRFTVGSLSNHCVEGFLYGFMEKSQISLGFFEMGDGLFEIANSCWILHLMKIVLWVSSLLQGSP